MRVMSSIAISLIPALAAAGPAGQVAYSPVMGRSWLTIVLVGALTACGSPSATSPSPTPLATSDSASGLPPTCAPIDLRTPDGGVVDLTGVWAGSSRIAGRAETAQLLQMGDCVYASVRGENSIYSATGVETKAEIVTILVGHLRPDFTVGFEVFVVSQPVWNTIAEYSPMVMIVEWDDTTGQIRLREDREPGSMAQRCIAQGDPLGFCLVPVIWYRVAESPPS